MKPLAVITGGQQGIGLGILEALVRTGYRVAILSERPKSDPAVQQVMSEHEGNVHYLEHDVREISQHESVIAKLVSAFGPIHTFVSNAGIASPKRGDMFDITPEHFDRVMDINLRGAFFLAQAVSHHMLSTEIEGYRSLTFITSVSAEMASIERADYCISKAAASMMVKTLALRLAAHDIGVFELRPGIIKTAMTEAVQEAYSARIEDGLVPAKRWGTPRDIGALLLPIARGDMAFATGSVIAVDGGLSVARL